MKIIKIDPMILLPILLTIVSISLGQVMCITDCHAQAKTGKDASIIKVFKNPDMDSKNMFRWWFPSADVEESLIKE